MDIFGRATGQLLNLDKTTAMWLLAPPEAEPDSSKEEVLALAEQFPTNAHGLQLLRSSKVLGIQVGDVQNSDLIWDQRIDKLKSALGNVVRLPLSVFGRAFCTSSYAVSTVLYHAEFSDLPSTAHIARLNQLFAKVVEAGLHPMSNARVFRGVRADLLPGRPCEGGFGALHWLEHIRSRHIRWAIKLATEADDKAWIFVCRHLLKREARSRSPQLPSLGLDAFDILLSKATVEHTWITRGAQPLRRLFRAVAAFPSLIVTPRQPGPWC